MFGFDTLSTLGSLTYLAVALVIFSEIGVLFLFFLPGDTLLFAAGIAASQGRISLLVLALSVAVAATGGNALGYAIGKKAGPRIFGKKDASFFSTKRIETARLFFESRGGLSITLSNFLPGIRTFLPAVAGMSKMPFQKFLLLSGAGGILWGAGMPMAGYFLGKRFPEIDRFIIPVVLLAILASVIPLLWKRSMHTRP